MMIHFHTNLDEAQRYIPSSVDTKDFPIPRVGERIQLTKFDNFYFELEVVQVVYDFRTPDSYHRVSPDKASVRVELHIPKTFIRSITDWSEWFHRLGR